MSFLNRWMIVGRLTTTAPLHIGNGDVTERKDFTNDKSKSDVTRRKDLNNEKSKEAIQINAIGTDHNGRPYLPGSSLKGNLRALANQLKLPTVEEIFGSPDPELKTSVGGKAEFYDACVPDNAPVFPHDPPHWLAARRTGVSAGVTIDRITRTASDERLFHEEFVPPGVSFEVKISGQDYTDAEITDLLWLLNSFNSGVAKLGAGTGSGYGSMKWELTDLQRMTTEDVARWIANGAPSTGYAALQSLKQAERQTYETRAAQVRTVMPQPEALILNIRLDFQSNFLVNDPSRTGTLDEKKAGHTPLLNVDGKPLLHATSIRGAFRSQAEKIVRTIGNEKCACYLNDRGERASCLAIESIDALPDLCPTCQIFGAAGWKAAIQFSDFLAIDSIREENLFQQEFVAIDRFTGGGAEAKKFNARSMDRPTLHGTITIDLARLKNVADNGWPLGLLVLVLRDLIEGDVRFGLGSAKGYGTARLTIEGLRLPDWDICPSIFKIGISHDQWGLLSAANAPDEPTQKILMQWVTDLQTRIQHEGANQ